MKLFNPSFERQLLGQAKKLCYAQPDWRRQWRKARKANPTERMIKDNLGLMVKPLVLLLVVGCLAPANIHALSPQWQEIPAVVAIWWLVTILWGSPIVRNLEGRDHAALLLLPCLPEDLKRRYGERLRALLFRPLGDVLLVLLLIALLTGAGPVAFLIAVPLAAIHALLTWAVCLVLSPVRLPVWLMASPFWISFALIGWCSLVSGLSERLYQWFVASAPCIVAVVPGGWVVAAFLGLSGLLELNWVYLLLPLVIPISLAPWAYRRVLERSNPEGCLRAQYVGELEGEEKEHYMRELADFQEKEVQATREAPDPLSPVEWQKRLADSPSLGWVERIFVRWLSARERTLLEFTCSSVPRWTVSLKKALIKAALGLISLWVGIEIILSGGLELACMAFCGAGVILLVIATFGVLPFGVEFGRAYRSISIFGVNIAAPALYPVSLGEVARLTIKAAVVRGVIAGPVFTAAGIMIGLITDGDLTCWSVIGLKAALLSIVASPWLVVLISAGQGGGGTAVTARGVAALLLVALVCILLIVLGNLALFGSPLESATAFAAFGLLSSVALWVHLIAYRRGWFDLISVQKSTL